MIKLRERFGFFESWRERVPKRDSRREEGVLECRSPRGEVEKIIGVEGAKRIDGCGRQLERRRGEMNKIMVNLKEQNKFGALTAGSKGGKVGERNNRRE